ncbi:MAG: hypothetical protein LBP88_07100 [Treponema sp.]|nr:hypothetical protein [Treponema sp.]
MRTSILGACRGRYGVRRSAGYGARPWITGRIVPRSWEGAYLDPGKDRTSILGRIAPRSWEGSYLDPGKERTSILGRIAPRSWEGSSLTHGLV